MSTAVQPALRRKGAPRRPRIGYARGRVFKKLSEPRAQRHFLNFRRPWHKDFWRILPVSLDHAILLYVMGECAANGAEFCPELPNAEVADLANCDVRSVEYAVKGLLAPRPTTLKAQRAGQPKELPLMIEESEGSARYKVLEENWQFIEDAPRRKPVRSEGLSDDKQDEVVEPEPEEALAKTPTVVQIIEHTILRPGCRPKKVPVDFGVRSIAVQVKGEIAAGVEVEGNGGDLLVVVEAESAKRRRNSERPTVESITSGKSSETGFASNQHEKRAVRTEQEGDRLHGKLQEFADKTQGCQDPNDGMGGKLVGDALRKSPDITEDDCIAALSDLAVQARTMNNPMGYLDATLPQRAAKIAKLRLSGAPRLADGESIMEFQQRNPGVKLTREQQKRLSLEVFEIQRAFKAEQRRAMEAKGKR